MNLLITNSQFSKMSHLTTKQKDLLMIGNDQLNITPFQRRVYEALCCVPEGKVTTYQHIAKFIHCRSSQAVGQALKRNPYAPIIPCHRVVRSDGTIGGFQGKICGESISKKIRLLQNEGVSFTSSGNVDPLHIDDLSRFKKAKGELIL